jgi:sugar lactone lactonase YvrE
MRPIRELALAVLCTITITAPAAQASTWPVDRPAILAHFDLARQQMPENIALEPDGSADLTFSGAAQIARVNRRGDVRLIAQLPVSTRGKCPIVPFHTSVSGIVRDQDGTLYTGLCTGTADLQGIWRVSPGRSPIRIAALPSTSFPNGIALDSRTGQLYVADAARGAVWRIPRTGGAPTLWTTGTALAPQNFIGANGVKVHDNGVWVSNTDNGTLLRIPIRPDGTAGPIQVRASGLTGIDDFAFTSYGDTVLAALNETNRVEIVTPDGHHYPVLGKEDGLSNPSSIAVRNHTVYVPNAAYLTQQDPSLLTAHLTGPPNVQSPARHQAFIRQ